MKAQGNRSVTGILISQNLGFGDEVSFVKNESDGPPVETGSEFDGVGAPIGIKIGAGQRRNRDIGG